MNVAFLLALSGRAYLGAGDDDSPRWLRSSTTQRDAAHVRIAAVVGRSKVLPKVILAPEVLLAVVALPLQHPHVVRAVEEVAVEFVEVDPLPAQPIRVRAILHAFHLELHRDYLGVIQVPPRGQDVADPTLDRRTVSLQHLHDLGDVVPGEVLACDQEVVRERHRKAEAALVVLVVGLASVPDGHESLELAPGELLGCDRGLLGGRRGKVLNG